MKTKALLSIQVFGIISTTMISCSKEDRIGPQELAVSTPILHHIVDTVNTTFFTSGSYGEVIYLYWGNEKGNLSVTSSRNSDILVKNDPPYVLSWDKNLDLGIYPITVKAENSEGSDTDNLVLVSNFGGDFIMIYNHNPESSINGLSIRKPLHFDPKGSFWHHDAWDYGNSIEGNWAWVSKNEIQGSFSNYGRINDYSFKATLGYDKETGLPQLYGYWYDGPEATAGKEIGQIKFYKDYKFVDVYNETNWRWEDYPYNPTYYDPIENHIDKDKFAGWFTATCYAGPESASYRLYLGNDKKIFRGIKNSQETWAWVSDNEIQGTFMEHQDFEGAEEKFITFRGKLSIVSNGSPFLEGQWYRGKVAIAGEEAGEIKLEYENWDW